MVKRKTQKRGKSLSKRHSARASSAKKTSFYLPENKEKFKSKINLVVRNLLTFAVLFVFSIILYVVSKSASNEMMINLFWILSLLTGFLSVTFILVLLIFLIIKGLKR